MLVESREDVGSSITMSLRATVLGQRFGTAPVGTLLAGQVQPACHGRRMAAMHRRSRMAEKMGDIPR
jgi:hypothetical protein